MYDLSGKGKLLDFKEAEIRHSARAKGLSAECVVSDRKIARGILASLHSPVSDTCLRKNKECMDLLRKARGRRF